MELYVNSCRVDLYKEILYSYNIWFEHLSKFNLDHHIKKGFELIKLMEYPLTSPDINQADNLQSCLK